MHTGNTIIKNTFILTSGQIITKIINLLLLVILTRILGKNGFGLYSFALAFGSMFMLLTHFGINTLIVKEIAQDRSKATKLINQTLSMILILSLATLIIINLAAYLSGWTTAEKEVIFILSIYIILDSISRYFISIFRAHQRMEFEVIVNVVDRTGLLICAGIIWFVNSNLILLLILFSIVGLVKASIAYTLVSKYFIKPKLNLSLKFLTSVLKQSYPFALVGIFGSITIKIDTIMLKYFHTDEVVGLYNAARKLIESVSFIPENISIVLFPALSAIYLSNRNKFNQTFERFFELMLILAIPITAGIFILSPKIIQLLFIPEFKEASIALKWLSLALGFLFLKHTFATTLNSMGKQFIFSIIIGLAMLINIVLNYILIPEYHILGASLATLFAEFITTVLAWIICHNFLKISLFSFKLLKTIIAGLIVTLFIYHFQYLNIFMLISITTLIYIAMLIVLGILSENDRQYFTNIILNKIKTKNK